MGAKVIIIWCAKGMFCNRNLQVSVDLRNFKHQLFMTMKRIGNILLFLMAVLLVSCNNHQTNNTTSTDLDAIQKRGKLIALTDFNSISYFIYRGTPMGYQYELLKDLAAELDLDLEIHVSNNLQQSFDMLINNECDLLAINLTITSERQKLVNFTQPISQTQQILVQLTDKQRAKYNPDYKGGGHIKSTLDMAQKTIHVVKNSSFAARLRNIETEIGDSINIVEVDNIDSEQLIWQVVNNDIDYCITDQEVALVNKTYYPTLDISTIASLPQNMAWAVNKNNPQLLDAVNEWITKIKKSPKYAILYEKYFRDPKTVKRAQSPYLSFKGGNISVYDDEIKKCSKIINWDWRLFASLVYQESRFNADAISWAGAFGLMQLMPETAQRYGVDEESTPEANLKAGAKFLKWIDKQLQDSVPDQNERIKFVLAAYNIGLGHIFDAQRVARANGYNPQVWDGNVDYFLLHKSDNQYYDPELVRNGYCRGIETYNFVRSIMERYRIYKTLIN